MVVYNRIQPNRDFFSEDEKKESIHIEGSAPYGAILINQSSEGETSTMLVVKWSDNVEVLVDNIDNTLWGGLYKGDDDSLVTW